VLPLEVDGGRVTISGIADLVHITDDRIEIVDYKTDQTRRAHEEYRKQLSVYYHVLEAEFPDREVVPTILYTADDEHVVIEPLSIQELQSLVRNC
jgi:ATP-dependent exoDNAse (exonuclease V) beta subunit